MKANKQKTIAISYCFSLLIGVAACQNVEQHNTSDYEKRLIGKWKFNEINNGVTCKVTFYSDHRLTQLFELQDGTGKERLGEWSVSEDTLWISEQTGKYSLLFEELNDSVMMLLTHDSIPVGFDRITEISVE